MRPVGVDLPGSDAGGERVDAFPAGADARAVVEGQFLSMRLHCANLGIRPRSILATGGASAATASTGPPGSGQGTSTW